MTKLSLTISLVLCLLLSAGCMNAPKPPTPPPTQPRLECSLVPCRLPYRLPVLVNEQWGEALDAADAALLSCAKQVLACIDRQNTQRLDP